MTDEPQDDAPRSVTSIWPAVIIIVFAVAVFWGAQAYSPNARRFPTMVAGLLFVLGFIDLWSRTDLPGRNAIAAFWGTGFGRREMAHVPGLRAELVILGWVLGAFAGMAVFGILAALPLFCLAFVWRWAGQPLRVALFVALMLFAFEYAVFEWLLDYDLYRGLLFGKGGLSRW